MVPTAHGLPTGAGRAELHHDTVIDHCHRFLPAYMVPDVALPVAELPRDARGKADRRAVLELVASYRDTRGPQTWGWRTVIHPASAEPAGVDFVHDSPILGRRKAARVLVPDGPPPDGGRPTRYLLHSFGGDRRSWLRHGAPFEDISAVFVFPESGRRWFINDIAGHRYADYLVAELLPAVEAQFPCQRARGSRIVGRFSMGGAAAVYLSLVHPELIGAAFSYGGAFYASDRVWGPPGSQVRKRYDPDRLLAAAARRPPPSITIETGLQDYPRVLAQNRRMHEALTSAGLRHHYTERPGDHSWPFAVAAAARFLRSGAARARVS